MENPDIFKPIHAVELFTNEIIVRWMNAFDHNIGISPVLVLGELNKMGPQKQTTLAKKLGYMPGAMTNIANRLIKQEMAERKYNEDDRRNVLLSITDKGRDILKEAQLKGQELRVEMFQKLNEEELQQFLKILTRYIATQYGKDKIRCNGVAPGLILTPAAARNMPPAVLDIFQKFNALPYHGEADDIGNTVLFLASDESKFITGQTIEVEGGHYMSNPSITDFQNYMMKLKVNKFMRN